MRLIYAGVVLTILLFAYGCQTEPGPVTKPGPVTEPGPVTKPGPATEPGPVMEPGPVTEPPPIEASSSEEDGVIKLPEPQHDSEVSIEQSMLQRRSIRSYTGEPLTLGEVSQLLWAAQGITDARGHRTAPSAGALYPLEVYLVVGNVENLAPGVYEYEPKEHELVLLMDGDKRSKLAAAALGQSSVATGAVDVVITAVYKRTTVKYGERGIRYVHIEVGHAAQNLVLQATAMKLGAVTVGAFSDEGVADLLNLPSDETPLYIIPVGRK